MAHANGKIIYNVQPVQYICDRLPENGFVAFRFCVVGKRVTLIIIDTIKIRFGPILTCSDKARYNIK